MIKNQSLRFFGITLAIMGLVPTAVFSGDEVVAGWERSYKAGVTDRNGQYMGGSELMHLVGHKGMLFASNGYWQDSRNTWYGGKDKSTGWAQVLRLDKPGGQWEVDLEMGLRHLRGETLQSITFTTNSKGELLKDPVNLLFASAYKPNQLTLEVTLYTRDDATGKWVTSTIYTGPNTIDNEDRSVRAICVHRDKVTGIDHLFISIGKLGIFSGVYDASIPSKILWEKDSESGPVETRPLAMIEAGGDLLFSAGRKIYRRNDGTSPSYTVVYDISDLYSGAVVQADGGIRGLTAIPCPSGKGESLLFAVSEGGSARGAIYRLDPTKEGRYTRVCEVYLDQLMSKYLNGNPVHFVLPAYNDLHPVVDPATNETVHLIGFESWISGHRFPLWGENKEGGFYAGGMYAIRDKNGHYRLKEVNGRSTPSKPSLVSIRAIATSPFKGHEGEIVYFGGHDGNMKPSHNMAWIFSTSCKNALQIDGPETSVGTAVHP